MLPLTVVTNSLEIALMSAGVPGWRVVMPGGTVRPGSTMLAGSPGEEFFAKVHADIFFVGALAVTGGLLTDATLEVAAIKRAMMQSARRRILLVDSSKFRPPCFSAFGDISEIDEVITDDGIQPETLAIAALGARRQGNGGALGRATRRTGLASRGRGTIVGLRPASVRTRTVGQDIDPVLCFRVL